MFQDGGRAGERGRSSLCCGFADPAALKQEERWFGVRFEISKMHLKERKGLSDTQLWGWLEMGRNGLPWCSLDHRPESRLFCELGFSWPMKEQGSGLQIS